MESKLPTDLITTENGPIIWWKDQKIKIVINDLLIISTTLLSTVKKLVDTKKPRTIVYVSCDPASLARDTKLLLENNYSLDKIIAIDLFPMTHHIECVAKFKQTTNLPKKSG